MNEMLESNKYSKFVILPIDEGIDPLNALSLKILIFKNQFNIQCFKIKKKKKNRNK